MSEGATPDGWEGLPFRQWDPSRESWDDYIRALEHAYAQYVDRRRRTIVAEQTPSAPDSADPQP